MRRAVVLVLFVVCFAFATASADNIIFNTFVSQASIAAVTAPSPNTGVIGYTYAGNKFVGSLFPNDGRLYSTDLNGGNIQPFGTVPGAGGETVLAGALGSGGFTNGNIFAGSGANGNIYQFSNSGGAPTLFATVGSGQIRSIMFDPGSSFGGRMIVATTTGAIYAIDHFGNVQLIHTFGFDTEGTDIVGATFGPFAGYLLTASEGAGQVNLVSPTGAVVNITSNLPNAETVAYVPLNLGSGDPSLEGFYGANYASDIIKADTTQFTKGYSQLGGRSLLGDAIVTVEVASNGPVYDIHWNGSGFDPLIQIGAYPNQPEDGIFVTAQRIQGSNVPEPSSILLISTGMLGIAGAVRRKLMR